MNLNDSVRARSELEQAIATGQPTEIARAAMFHLWPLLADHTELLITTVTKLELSHLERFPVLRLIHPRTAVLARASQPFKPLLLADEARRLGPDEIDFLIATQMIAFRTSGDIDAAVVYARRLEGRLATVRVEARDRLDGPLWYFHHQIGSTLLTAGDSAGALLSFATARQLGRLSAQPDAERTALGRIALAHALRGSLVEAERALAEARGMVAPTSANVTASISTEHTTAALIAVARLDSDLDARLEALSPYDSIDLTWPFVLLCRVRAFLAQNRPDDALELIRLTRDAHPVHSSTSYAQDVIVSTTIDTLAGVGSVGAARRFAAEHTRAGGSPGMLARLAIARLMLRDAKWDAAAAELRLMSADPDPAQRAESTILLGWFEVAVGAGLSRDTAILVHRVLRRRDYRRLVTIAPRALLRQVRELIPAEAVTDFDAAISGLPQAEIIGRPRLTPGETRVLHALADHRSTKDMATAFGVSSNTIKTQLRSLFRKLESGTRDEALRAAWRHGFIRAGSTSEA